MCEKSKCTHAKKINRLHLVCVHRERMQDNWSGSRIPWNTDNDATQQDVRKLGPGTFSQLSVMSGILTVKHILVRHLELVKIGQNHCSTRQNTCSKVKDLERAVASKRDPSRKQMSLNCRFPTTGDQPTCGTSRV